MLVPQNSTCGDDEIEIEVQATHIFNRKSVQFEILQPIFVLEKPLMVQRGLADVDRQDLGGRVCVRKDRCLIRPAASDKDVHLGLIFAIGPQHAMLGSNHSHFQSSHAGRSAIGSGYTQRSYCRATTSSSGSPVTSRGRGR